MYRKMAMLNILCVVQSDYCIVNWISFFVYRFSIQNLKSTLSFSISFGFIKMIPFKLLGKTDDIIILDVRRRRFTGYKRLFISFRPRSIIFL